jgi:hypothetical protein
LADKWQILAPTRISSKEFLRQLLAEDMPHERLVIKSRLKTALPANVEPEFTEIDNAEMAVELVRSRDFDLVIMDFSTLWSRSCRNFFNIFLWLGYPSLPKRYGFGICHWSRALPNGSRGALPSNRGARLDENGGGNFYWPICGRRRARPENRSSPAGELTIAWIAH